MQPNWVFPETTPYSVQGRDLSEDNFAQEDRTNLDILIREALQNPLDARAPDNDAAVRVRISVVQPGAFDANYLSTLITDEYCRRLEASGAGNLPELKSRAVMVVEDFGTTGLQGTYSDSNKDGSAENWNAFWFREGEGAKSAPGSNGRAGQGKITYYRVGGARAVFGLTVRKADGKALLMGRSAFRRGYTLAGKKYIRHSFWCCESEQPLPVEEAAEIARFARAFKLERNQQPGLSLVIPCPVDFVPKDAIRTIVAEFYYPIASGRLEVTVGDSLHITASSIDSLADSVLPDVVVREKRTGFTSGFRALVRDVIAGENAKVDPIELKRGWDRASAISDDQLPAGALENLRADVESGKRISVRCPLTIRPKTGGEVNSWFDVHLRVPDDLERPEEAYIRRDLLIGSERHLTSASHLQKAMALTIIQDGGLSAFLADAEEPTHLKWNASRPRLAEDYSTPGAALRAVRNAAPRILALVLNGLEAKDVKALARYFAKPSDSGRTTPGGKRPKGGGDTKPETDPPEPVRKPFRIVAGADRITVLPNGSAAPTREHLPAMCSLEIAYEGLDQDPFKAYDPFDFDLSDVRAHPISTSGAVIVECSGNRLIFEIRQPEFEVRVPGFDPNIRLRARLNYTEKASGTTVSEE